MPTNRSVPTDTVLPHLIYDDAEAAIDWLCANLGFVEHYRVVEDDSGRIHTAQVHLGDAYLMIRNPGRPGGSPRLTGGSQMLTIMVDDVDAHYAKAKAGGAEITEELGNAVYGERQYGLRDPGGHDWLFSQHAEDIDPATFACVAG